MAPYRRLAAGDRRVDLDELAGEVVTRGDVEEIVGAVERILGIDRVTLYNKMRKYGIRRDGEAEDSPHEPTGSTSR